MLHVNVIWPLLGGALMGLSAAILMFFHGRVAGIGGILHGVLVPRTGDVSWRALYLAGVVAGAVLMMALRPVSFESSLVRSPGALMGAGLLVGFGVRLGNGCTSGHGLCGIARFSVRSVVATVVFIATGAITVALVNRLAGGSL